MTAKKQQRVPEHEKVRTDLKGGVRPSGPSQRPDQGENNRLGAGASQPSDAVEASPTRPLNEPASAVQATLDQQGSRRNNGPAASPPAPNKLSADIQALLERAAEQRRNRPVAPPSPPYEPTAAERAALDKQAERRKRSTVAPRLKVTDDDRGVRYDFDHPDATVGRSLVMELIGTDDPDFLCYPFGPVWSDSRS